MPTNDSQLATAIVTAPAHWFRNIIALQEKRQFSVYTVMMFCAFVAIARVLGEWFLGARQLWAVPIDLLGHFVFYWYSFFTFGSILALLVPQPWKKSINVILIGIFLGVLPPVVDLFFYEIGSIRYGYFWGFPEGWNALIYNPDKRFHFGETLILWLTIFFTAAYVLHKTKSLWRTAAAAALAYGVVVFNAGVLPTGLRELADSMEWGQGHLINMMMSAQILACVVLYLFFQPKLAWGLLKRTHHSLPFAVMVLIGAAYAEGLNGLAAWHAFLIWLMFQTALVQNDFFDVREDAFQGREAHADADDVAFFTTSAILLVVVLLQSNSAVGLLALMILVLSFLYSYPYYRGKRYFPSNLKMEGGWGLSAFLAGMLGAIEYGLADAPRWKLPIDPSFRTDPPTPGLSGIIACFLVFGGHSLLAMLKDYKDVAADRHGGIHTVYTLAAKRGMNLKRVNSVVAGLALVCLALPWPLLYAAEMVTGMWIPVGVGLVALIGLVAFRLNEKRQFDLFLWLLTGYLLYLLTALALR